MTNEQHIENLKKLKSFHNGSYGADIDRAIKALEQVSCEDTISRQAVKELYYKDGYIDFRKICELPSVKSQEPKTGHWMPSHIPESILDECSECGFSCGAFTFNYCPNCGAKMVEPQERSDKE